MTGVRSGEDRLYWTISRVLNVASGLLSEESSPETISSWDSLNHINLVMAVEAEFRVRVTAQDALDMRNVALIRAILREHGAEV